MKKLDKHEFELEGKLIFKGGSFFEDEILQRIKELKDSYLHKIAADSSGWGTLYRDPYDGRFWELIYPDSEAQGGGACTLRTISAEEAQKRYIF